MRNVFTLFVLFMLSILIAIILFKDFSANDVPEETKDTVVSITNVNYGQHYQQSEIKFLKGTALAFNGDFSDQIIWESNIDGQLGTGRTIKVKLSRGTHYITAKADNGYEKGTDSTSITIYKNVARDEYEKPKDRIATVYDRDGDKLIVNRDKGVIVDTSTNLMWQRCPETYVYTYDVAINYAKESNLGGYSNWRLPTKEELIDIHNIYHDGRQATLQNEFITFKGKFWSSTLVCTKFGNIFRFGVEQVDLNYDTEYSLLARQTNISLDSEVFIRLVRNIE